MTTKRAHLMMIMAGVLGIDCVGRAASLGDVGGSDPDSQDAARISIANKVDLVLVVDDSLSTDDKRALLGKTAPEFVDRLFRPNCLDASGKVVGRVVDGACKTGSAEFRPVEDLHVAVTGTSLPIPEKCVEQPLGGRFNTRGADKVANPRATANGGFLSWSKGSDEALLKSDIGSIVEGTYTEGGGCGYEAALESWYRLLAEPAPYKTVHLDSANRVRYDGIDGELLAARKAFLRPDSMLLIAMIGDEDDSSLDIGSFGGRGWAAILEKAYPPTSACEDDPFGPSCTGCQTCEPVPSLPANVRLFEPKRNLGIDPLFPLSRYTRALSHYAVPSLGNRTFDETTGQAIEGEVCVNPIFAGELPSDASADLCHLKAGVRTPSLVRFAVIGGVPRSLISGGASDPSAIEKVHLDAADWQRLVGQDPEHYNYTGADPHMIPSRFARAGLAGPTASKVADPIHGREIAGGDLVQASCAYTLAVPLDCSSSFVCPNHCADDTDPMCEGRKQVRASASPPTRLLTVAKSLGDRSIVSSICPTLSVTAAPSPEESDAFAYKPAFRNAVTSMAPNLAK